ncbi:MAG: sulfotransferase family protein [Candidatus Binatia bacterium]
MRRTAAGSVENEELLESPAEIGAWSDPVPSFIVGVPRSGTTLLVRLLGAHPLLAPIYETRFLRNLVRLCGRAHWFCGDSILDKLARVLANRPLESQFMKECNKFRRKVIAYYGRPSEICIFYTPEELERETDLWLQRLQKSSLTREEIYRSAKEFVDRLFAIHCERMNKPYWINKTPGLLNHLQGLSRLYPGAQCIHILRDGRDVAVSNLSRQWGPTNIRDAAQRWKNLMLEGRKQVDPEGLNYKELRYEELIQSPAATLGGILDFLGLGGDPDEMLSHVRLYDRSIGAWRTVFTPEDRRTFAKAAGDLLVELGYEKDHSWV